MERLTENGKMEIQSEKAVYYEMADDQQNLLEKENLIERLKTELAEKDKQLAISNKTTEILYELRDSLVKRIKLSNNIKKSDIWLSVYDCKELYDYQAEAEEALK